MKIGLIPCNVGVPNVDMIVHMAKTAEEIGLESLWTFEHAIVPVDYQSAYPYSAEESVSMIIRVHYEDGSTEDHPLRNGVHIADYVRRRRRTSSIH